MQSRSFDRSTIMNITLVVEAVMLLVAAFWIQAAQIELTQAFKLSRNGLIIGILAGCGTALSGFVIIWLGKVIEHPPLWITELSKIVFEEVAPLFASLKPSDILILSLASGFCEEIFFRGVLQSQLSLLFVSFKGVLQSEGGLAVTSILFGLFHCPSPRHLSYGLWAVSAGLLLGWLRDWTGSLWVPIIAHSLSNFIAITALRYMASSTKYS